MCLFKYQNGNEVPVYQHVERLTTHDMGALLDGDVVVQAKVDGANLTVAFDMDLAKEKGCGIIIASRNTMISRGGEPKVGFRGAVEYVLGHTGINQLMCLFPDWILRGEWLVHHHIKYPKEVMSQFYVFDVQLRDSGNYVHVDDYAGLLGSFGVQMVPVLARIARPTTEQLVELSKRQDLLGGEYQEGIVIKTYGDYVDRFGRVTWAKVLNPDFEKSVGNKRHKVSGDEEGGIEQEFVELVVSEHFVGKIFGKIRDKKNGEVVTIKDMAQIMGRAWYEVFSEELHDFVQKRKVSKFDFVVARKRLEQEVRKLALEMLSREGS